MDARRERDCSLLRLQLIEFAFSSSEVAVSVLLFQLSSLFLGLATLSEISWLLWPGGGLFASCCCSLGLATALKPGLSPGAGLKPATGLSPAAGVGVGGVMGVMGVGVIVKEPAGRLAAAPALALLELNVCRELRATRERKGGVNPALSRNWTRYWLLR